jgi:hypothetical protein
MTEVAGDGAFYLDPGNPAAAAAVLKDALQGLAGIREAGLRNAARFRSGMIEAYVTLYEKLCSDKRALERTNQFSAIRRRIVGRA